MVNGRDQSEGTHHQSENNIVNVPPTPPSTPQVPQSPPPPAPIVDHIQHTPTPPPDPLLNLAPSDYPFTEGLSSYPNWYTPAAWDNLFFDDYMPYISHSPAPLCSDFEDNDTFVLPLWQQTPPFEDNNNSNNSNSPELLNSSPALVVDESDNHANHSPPASSVGGESNFEDVDAIVLPLSQQTPPLDGNNNSNNNNSSGLLNSPPSLVVDEFDNHVNASPPVPSIGGESNFEDIDAIVLPSSQQTPQLDDNNNTNNDNNNNSPKLLDSPPNLDVHESNDNHVNPAPPTPTVGGESDTQHQVTLPTTSVTNESDDNQVIREVENLVIAPPTTLPSAATISDDAKIFNATPSVDDSSIKRKKQVRRPRKNRRAVRAQSDGAAAPQDQTQQSNAGGCTPQEEAAASQLQMQLQAQFWGSKHRIPQPTIILIDRGKDVAEKITSFAKERRVDFIKGTVGCLSVVELLLQEKTVTFEGIFQIIDLEGSFLPPKNGDQHTTCQLSIKFVGSDGKVVGGPVHGRLIAESVVQTVAYTWTSDGHDGEMENNLQ